MGEAIYYFMAVFDNEEHAELGSAVLKRYLREHGEAHDFWQDHRGESDIGKLMEAKFPLVSAAIRPDIDKAARPGRGVDGNTHSGYLIDMGAVEVLERTGNRFYFSALVWHFDHWAHLVRFALVIPGCVKADYLSDEYLSEEESDAGGFDALERELRIEP